MPISPLLLSLLALVPEISLSALLALVVVELPLLALLALVVEKVVEVEMAYHFAFLALNLPSYRPPT